MVENTNNSMNSNMSEGADSILSMSVLELKMKCSKVDTDEEKVLMALMELGERGCLWYENLETKPETWKEMKRMLEERNVEILENRRKFENEHKIEKEIKRRVEEKLNEEKMKFKEEIEKMKQIYGMKRQQNGRIGGMKVIRCYQRDEVGHIAKWCKNGKGLEEINKINKEYMDSSIKINYDVKKIKGKKYKVTLDDFKTEFPTVFFDSKEI